MTTPRAVSHDTEVRLALVEHAVAAIDARIERFETGACAKLETIERAIVALQLHEARMEWLERMLWIALGCVIPMAIAVLAALVQYAPQAAGMLAP